MKRLLKCQLLPDRKISLGGSKSISNRLLILWARFPQLEVTGLGDAEDVQRLKTALATESGEVDIHHAGTAMRFLTAYFALHTTKKRILTGSSRMKERPIAPLVQALQSLGCNIRFLEKPGFPPLEILPPNSLGKQVTIDGAMSSQFISALLLSGQELEVILKGEITSRPYLEMTLHQLREIGIEARWEGTRIYLPENPNVLPQKIAVESDWSSASYLYSLVGIGRLSLVVQNLFKTSIQGDARMREIAETYFGIRTEGDGELRLVPDPLWKKPERIELDLNDIPDLAQTLCVLCAAWRIPFRFSGLQTLKIKETDRLAALQKELWKIGCQTEISSEHIATVQYTEPDVLPRISTYEDHRMALSFAPFCLKSSLEIEHPEVVAKSYPRFWQDLNYLTQ